MTVPFGTDITALSPSIAYLGSSLVPPPGSVEDFSSPIVYTGTSGIGATQNYTVTVTIELPSTDSFLASLSISSGILNPAFDPGTTGYLVSLPYDVVEIDILVIRNDPVANVVIVPGEKATLSTGWNRLSITVAAQDGTTTTQYTVTAFRAALDDHYSENAGIQVNIPAGRFQRDVNYLNISELSQSFRLGKHEVSRAQYSWIMGYDPTPLVFAVDMNAPVQGISWYDALEYCNTPSVADGLQPVYSISARVPSGGYPITSASVTAGWHANGYRLPTSTEWTWAAMDADRSSPGEINRTGYVLAFAGSTGSTAMADYVWFSGNADLGGGKMAQPAGTKLPNSLGLHDMSGNVHE